MKLLERSYSSKTFRPKPHLHVDADAGLIVIATSWGLPEHAEKAVNEITKHVVSARGDVEVTSHFEVMSTMTKEANDLRVGLMMANDVLSRGENKSEYISGIEVLAIIHDGHQLSWAQVGAPHLLIARKNQAPTPVSLCFDHSFQPGKRFPPLPSRLLGVERSCQMSCGDLTVSEDDQVILLSSSKLPSSLWNMQGTPSLESLTQHLAKDDEDAPFWLGLLDLTG